MFQHFISVLSFVGIGSVLPIFSTKITALDELLSTVFVPSKTSTQLPTAPVFENFSKVQPRLQPSQNQTHNTLPILDIMLGNQGALGATFVLSRYAQAASMIAVIGMTSNFIAEMVSASMSPSEVLVGTLSVVRATCPVLKIDTNYPVSGLHRRALLRHHSHSLPRQPTPLPGQCDH